MHSDRSGRPDDRPVPADDIGLMESPMPERDPEGPSEADIRSSERATSGRTGKWLARAGIIFLIIALLSLIIPAIMLLFPPGAGAPGRAPGLPPKTSATVTDVIDGITIRVEIDGQSFLVRYLGIALPPQDDPWSSWAGEVNRRWVEGKSVLLERDITDADEEGRLLRYVWVDELFVNGAMLAVGLGTHIDQFPDLRYSADLDLYEGNARAEKVGIWQTRGT